jgi:hypothetical protein
MANEIQADYASGSTLYAVIRNATGAVWHTAGQAFEVWGTSGRTADDYHIGLADKNGSRHIGDFDTDIPAGRYFVQMFLQAGANPADSDNLVTGCEIVWSGTGQVTAEKMLANKAIQNKASGTIEYYDDDGQTVLLAHTPTDEQTTITRTPA